MCACVHECVCVCLYACGYVCLCACLYEEMGDVKYGTHLLQAMRGWIYLFRHQKDQIEVVALLKFDRPILFGLVYDL